MLITALIKKDEIAQEKRVGLTHSKKLKWLECEQLKSRATMKNPNQYVLNLTGEEISDKEMSALQKGLNYSVCVNPKEAHMVAAGEALWDQIVRLNLVDLNNHKKADRIRTSIKAFTYSVLDMDYDKGRDDRDVINAIKALRSKYSII